MSRYIPPMAVARKDQMLQIRRVNLEKELKDQIEEIRRTVTEPVKEAYKTLRELGLTKRHAYDVLARFVLGVAASKEVENENN